MYFAAIYDDDIALRCLQPNLPNGYLGPAGEHEDELHLLMPMERHEVLAVNKDADGQPVLVVDVLVDVFHGPEPLRRKYGLSASYGSTAKKKAKIPIVFRNITIARPSSRS
jgi:hypothetical protein